MMNVSDENSTIVDPAPFGIEPSTLVIDANTPAATFRLTPITTTMKYHPNLLSTKG